MKLQAFAVTFMGLTTLGCAGTLDDPSRFEQGSQNTGGANGDGEAEDFDAGVGDEDSPGGNGSGDGLGGDGSNGSGDGLGGDGAPAGDGEGDGAPAEPACDFTALMTAKCIGCHNGNFASGQLDLASDGLAERVQVDAQDTSCGTGLLADPTAPEQSVLYLRVAGTSCGSLMPTGGQLTPDEVECVRSWIEGL